MLLLAGAQLLPSKRKLVNKIFDFSYLVTFEAGRRLGLFDLKLAQFLFQQLNLFG